MKEIWPTDTIRRPEGEHSLSPLDAFDKRAYANYLLMVFFWGKMMHLQDGEALPSLETFSNAQDRATATHTAEVYICIRNEANEWSLWHPFPFRYHSLKEKTIKHLTNIHSHPINTKQTQNTIYFLFRLFIWWKKMNGFSLQICAIAFAFAGSRCDGGGGLGSGCGAGVWSPDDVVRNV